MPDELYLRLQAFAFDPPDVAMPFVQRLARENGWSAAHANRVVDEYRRFLWLAMRAGHPVTPSPAVDAAWHLHLCYTRSYWDELCGKVLPRPLHHEPTQGGAGEAAKFRDWYARTLASYRTAFGSPPADVWPAVTERFRGGLPRVVDRRTHWIVAKPSLPRWAAIAAVAFAVPSLAGCVGAISDTSLVAVAVVTLVVAIGLAVVAMVRAGRGRSDGGPGGCATGGGASSGCGGGRDGGGCGSDSGGDGGGGGGCGGGCGGD
jgi:hypothetical protein